jgi:hypothetical protein
VADGGEQPPDLAVLPLGEDDAKMRLPTLRMPIDAARRRIPPTSTPRVRDAASGGSTRPRTVTAYSRSTAFAGSVSHAASCVSLVHSSSPDDARSSRPTGARPRPAPAMSA